MATLEQVLSTPRNSEPTTPVASTDERIPRSPIPVRIEQPEGDVPISVASEDVEDIDRVEGATETWQDIDERAQRSAEAREDEPQPTTDERENMKIPPGQSSPMSDLAMRICAVLMEPKQEVVHRAVECVGHEAARCLLDATLAILAAGGQVVSEGNRKRTPGGVFFRLIIAAVSNEDKKYIWAEDRKMRQAALKARIEAKQRRQQASEAPIQVPSAKGGKKGKGGAKGRSWQQLPPGAYGAWPEQPPGPWVNGIPKGKGKGKGKSKGPSSEIKVVYATRSDSKPRASKATKATEKVSGERSNKAPKPQDTENEATGTWSKGPFHKKATASKKSANEPTATEKPTITTTAPSEEPVAPTPQPTRNRPDPISCADGFVTPQDARLVPTPSGRSAVRSSNRGVPEPKEDGKTETKKDDVVADLASKFAETEIDVTDEKISSAEMLHRQLLASQKKQKKPDLIV